MSTMDAVENVALPLNFQGIDKKERIKRAEDVLTLVGLNKHKKHKPTQMSGGQQRVGVARHLLLHQKLFLQMNLLEIWIPIPRKK